MIFNHKLLISAKEMVIKTFLMTCNPVEPISAKVVAMICNQMLHTLPKEVVMTWNQMQLTYKVAYKTIGKMMDQTVTKWLKVWMMANQTSFTHQLAELASTKKMANCQGT